MNDDEVVVMVNVIIIIQRLLHQDLQLVMIIDRRKTECHHCNAEEGEEICCQICKVEAVVTEPEEDEGEEGIEGIRWQLNKVEAVAVAT